MTLTADVTIILASANPGKLAELRSLLGPSFTVRSATELGVELPEETGSTFEENAILKARAVAAHTGLMAVADDSGLEVDALGGAPGVYSARYAGEDSNDDRNTGQLLRALEDVPDGQRTARFRSAIAIAFTPDEIVTTSGSCEGTIIREKRGSGGFGYDPVFELPGGRTMAELGPDEKNEVSHRGHAMRAAIEILRQRLPGSKTNLEVT